MYNEKGNGVNALCLPHDPQSAPADFPSGLDAAAGVAHLFGSEYQYTYKNIAVDDDVPCSVCRVQTASAVLMIPAKTTCPDKWTRQYSGYLTAESMNHQWYDASEYLCVHGDAEYLTEGARQHNLDGRLFFPVTAVCGSLPCPPYQHGQYITCVVCSL